MRKEYQHFSLPKMTVQCTIVSFSGCLGEKTYMTLFLETQQRLLLMQLISELRHIYESKI